MAIVWMKLTLPPYFYYRDKQIKILPWVSSVFNVDLFILEATSCLTLGSVDTIYHDLTYPWTACIGAPYSALPSHSWLHHPEHPYCFSCQPLGDLLGSVPSGSVLLFLTLFKFFFPPSIHIDNSLSMYLWTCSLSDLQVTVAPCPYTTYLSDLWVTD